VRRFSSFTLSSSSSLPLLLTYLFRSLWLNESFATLVSPSSSSRSLASLLARPALTPPTLGAQIGEVVALNVIEPSWNVHSSFIKFHRSDALRLDALRSSHPIHVVCKHESDVPQTLCVLFTYLCALRSCMT